MEGITLILGNDAEYDAAVHHEKALPEGGDLKIITKDKATVCGNPGAVLTFTVQLPDGTMGKAQAVTTVGALVMAMAGLKGRYPQIG